MLRIIVCQFVMFAAVVVYCRAFPSAQATGIDTVQTIGIVVSAHGNWCDNAKKPCASLWRMYPVQQDSKLVRIQPTNGQESVTIRTRWGAKEIFDCSKPRELGCKAPLDLSRIIVQEKQKNVVTAFLDAVTELAANRPNVYDTFRQGILQVRGSDGQVLSDGVARRTKQGLILNQILGRLDAGNYLLELCPLTNTAEPACPSQSKPLLYSWDAKNPTRYPSHDVHSGIYRLYLWDTQTGDDQSGAPHRTKKYADVLIADESKYPTLSDNFRQVVEATRSWDADDSTAPALRRAYLYTLARQ